MKIWHNKTDSTFLDGFQLVHVFWTISYEESRQNIGLRK